MCNLHIMYKRAFRSFKKFKCLHERQILRFLSRHRHPEKAIAPHNEKEAEMKNQKESTTAKTTKNKMSLQHIDQQIEALKEKKKRLERKKAEALFKKVQKLFPDDNSDDLILGILETAAKELKENPQKKEVWLKTTIPFQQKSSSKKESTST